MPVTGKATKKTEAWASPDEKMLAAMGKYNEELVRAELDAEWVRCGSIAK